GPFTQRDVHRTRKLIAIERDAPSRALQHHKIAELHPFKRREARAALVTLATAADRSAVLGGTAVLHLGVFVLTKRAAHSANSLRSRPNQRCRTTNCISGSAP